MTTPNTRQTNAFGAFWKGPRRHLLRKAALSSVQRSAQGLDLTFQKHMGHVDSTLALVAVLMSPAANSNRIDVMAAWMRVVEGLNLDVQPDYWGPSIHALQAQHLVFADMATIQVIGNLPSIYEVPNDYVQAAEAAWLDAHAADTISVGFDHAH